MIYFGEISIWNHWSCDLSTPTICTGFKRECLILKLIACHLFQGKYFYKGLKANFSKACRHLRIMTGTRKAPRQLRCSWKILWVFGCAFRCPHTFNLFLRPFLWPEERFSEQLWHRGFLREAQGTQKLLSFLLSQDVIKLVGNARKPL